MNTLKMFICMLYVEVTGNVSFFKSTKLSVSVVMCTANIFYLNAPYCKKLAVHMFYSLYAKEKWLKMPKISI